MNTLSHDPSQYCSVLSIFNTLQGNDHSRVRILGARRVPCGEAHLGGDRDSRFCLLQHYCILRYTGLATGARDHSHQDILKGICLELWLFFRQNRWLLFYLENWVITALMYSKICIPGHHCVTASDRGRLSIDSAVQGARAGYWRVCAKCLQ